MKSKMRDEYNDLMNVARARWAATKKVKKLKRIGTASEVRCNAVRQLDSLALLQRSDGIAATSIGLSPSSDRTPSTSQCSRRALHIEKDVVIVASWSAMATKTLFLDGAKMPHWKTGICPVWVWIGWLLFLCSIYLKSRFLKQAFSSNPEILVIFCLKKSAKSSLWSFGSLACLLSKKIPK